MAQYNVPWTLRRFIPWYKHDYKQTSFDRQLSNTMPDVIDEMLSENRIEYDHTHLKGDGVPNFVPAKNYHMNDPVDGQMPGSAHSGPSRKVRMPLNPSWGGIGSGGHRSRESRSEHEGRDRPRRPNVGFGPKNRVEVEPDRPYRPDTTFGNRSPIRSPSTNRSVWGNRGGGGFGVFGHGRPRSSRGDPSGRGSEHVRSHPPAPVPQLTIAGLCPPTRCHHSGSCSHGHRSPPPIPGTRGPSHSQHDSRPSTRSDHHTTHGIHGSPPPTHSQHSHPPTGSSHHTAPDSPPPSHSQHSRPLTGASQPPTPGSTHHTSSRSHHSQPPPSHAGTRAPSRSQHSRLPTAPASSHHTAPHSHQSQPSTTGAGSRNPTRHPSECPSFAGSSHHSAHDHHRSALSSPPLAGSGMRSQHSGAGSGYSFPSRGWSGGSIQINSRGMTWKDV